MRIALFLLISLAILIGPVTSSHSQGDLESYRITCDPADFELIYTFWWLDFYIPCTLTYNDEQWPDCRMRIRGDSSREYPKKSLKVKTDGELFWNGRDTFNFNAEYADITYLHTVLASHLFSQAGVPCFTADHARLDLNGDFLGLYVRIENMDEDWLGSRGFDPSGNLYKATVDGACLSVWDDVSSVWEKKTGAPGVWDDLYQLIEDLNCTPDSSYYDWAQNALDYQEILSILAMNILIQNGSTYYHNYYVYHDINGGGTWRMFPWDLDKTVGYYEELPYQSSTGRSLPDNPMLERALLCEPMFQDLRDRVQSLGEQYFNRCYLDPLIDSLMVVLSASVMADTTDQVDDLAEWENRIAYEQEGPIAIRHQEVMTQIEQWPRSFRVDFQPEILTEPVTLRWHPSTDPQGDPINYMIRLNQDSWWPQEGTITYSGITDTIFTIPDPLEDGTYYFEIAAQSDGISVWGFDSPSRFQVATGTTLPDTVLADYLMTVSGSPYYITRELVVAVGAVLRGEPGVDIRFNQGGSMLVLGQLELTGTVCEPIRLRPNLNATSWCCLTFDSPSGPSTLHQVIIEGATEGGEPWQYAALNSRHTDLTMTHLIFRENQQCIHTYGGQVMLADSEFPVGNGKELTNFQLGTAMVERCSFHDVLNNGDAVDFDLVAAGSYIRDCSFYHSTDDLIDIGGASTVEVTGNYFQGAADNGITVDDGALVIMTGNLFLDCTVGVEVKNSGEVVIDRCTFYGDGTAVKCWEKYAGHGGGNALVDNTIFAQSDTLFSIDPLSDLQVTWSISDTDTLPGENNLLGDPWLIAPGELNFNLFRDSPCVNGGNPVAPSDPDGTRADMGAFPYNLGPEFVVINEINYNSALDHETGDWVELHNTSTVAVDMVGSGFSDGDDQHLFVFNQGTIDAGGYLVLCEDQFAFSSFHPHVLKVLGNMDFGFSGGGELLRLLDQFGTVLDSVRYDDDPPWPPEPDGQGATLELTDPELDNALPECWAASLIPYGTPGMINSTSDQTGLSPEMAPLVTGLGGNYPNPFNPRTTILFSLAQGGEVRLSIHDIQGRLVTLLVDETLRPGRYQRQWDGLGRGGESSASGIYLLRLTSPEGIWAGKITLLR